MDIFFILASNGVALSLAEFSMVYLAGRDKAAEQGQGTVYLTIFIPKVIVCWHSRATLMDFRVHCCFKRRERLQLHVSTLLCYRDIHCLLHFQGNFLECPSCQQMPTLTPAISYIRLRF